MTVREKTFNTAGPGQPDINYVYDPLKRINLAEVENLISARRYFVLHAPRQSGKTSCLLALRDYLNQQGYYHCVYANVEVGQALMYNSDSVNECIVSEIAKRTRKVVGSDMPENLKKEVLAMREKGNLLNIYLSRLCASLCKPLVLFLDEIDCLMGESLISVLRQLRAGYDTRPDEYPNSVILCGVRDVRDYRIQTSKGEIVTGGSAFNVKAESLRLGNFSPSEVRSLYAMHTDATGQKFDEGCFDYVWSATEGQPWLVNALAHEVTWKFEENRDRSITITPEMIYKAQERIIYRRDTHIDCLIDKLKEERVRRVIEPILSNSDGADDLSIPSDDLQYVIDLGLVVNDSPIRIANAIYREVIPRELTWTTQSGISDLPVSWFVNPDRSINIRRLLENFQLFFRQNADSWIQMFNYREAGPQLLLQAYLQRIVNGGGFIDREYGLGRRRTDLLIRKPLSDNLTGPFQYAVIELKILRGDLEKTILKGLRQTVEYMERAQNPELREGHFVVFNRKPGVSWDEKIFHKVREYNGYTVDVWGM